MGVYFSQLMGCSLPELKSGSLAINTGDTFSYLSGMDNLLEDGEYFFWNGERKVYAGRMPYYGAPYFIWRLFFSPAAAKDV
ncbi:MAG: hypothetical protein LH472_05175 [Pyrinomonadaceae bacterium]|nr:hypothetical protein [Pyrinomonadaceae bacterium]